MNRKIDELTHLIRQLLRQPYRVLGSSSTRNNNGTGDLQTAVDSAGIEDEVREQPCNHVSKNPRCFHTLWLEYNQGVGD